MKISRNCVFSPISDRTVFSLALSHVDNAQWCADRNVLANHDVVAQMLCTVAEIIKCMRLVSFLQCVPAVTVFPGVDVESCARLFLPNFIVCDVKVLNVPPCLKNAGSNAGFLGIIYIATLWLIERDKC